MFAIMKMREPICCAGIWAVLLNALGGDLLSTGFSQESRPPIAAAEMPEGFSSEGSNTFAPTAFSGWGEFSGPAPSSVDAWGEPLQAHVEPFEPWKELPWWQRSADDPRATGWGNPLDGTSWRNRPFHVGWLVGGLLGDDLIENDISQNDDLVGGYRFGWDFDHYWGTEVRVAFSNVDFTDPDDAGTARTAKNQFFDANLVYFPWGDAKWRPFVSAGLGVGRFKFTPADEDVIDRTLLLVPLGVGVKHYFRNWMALRLTVTDNWAIGRDAVATMHNWSITADVEMRFGGRRPSYYPYNGAIHIW